ncbi:uncharacterized protein LOC124440769 isoform X2 [Xenia sp. Carnegie-2017]|nr:uncharacterized protein LOC124440769 isoform X2 [Xenia sp. Carnegie-2017]XP_046847308.1 uncharacterized protein LOC124440769 isoform X2 [Xenia sp. Carnegie-2017]
MIVQTILSSKHLPLLNGRKLIIKKRTFKEQTEESSKQPSPKFEKHKGWKSRNCYLNQDVIERMKMLSLLDEQIQELATSISLNDDDLKLRNLVIMYLQEIFVEVFPTCKIVPFGSMVTGLGLKGADIDLCLQVDADILHSVIDQCDGAFDITEQVLDFIVDVLRKFAAGFKNVINVVSAKCPLVKFCHRDSGLSFDLSVNNRLALRNTNLIRSYLSLDGRIRTLAIVLKNWGASKGVSGRGGGHRLSNYSLMIMLLHFLQRTRPPVIPVLQFTSSSSESTDEDEDGDVVNINGWDCSFYSNVSHTSENMESLGKLLNEWFLYFSETFDYCNDVITIQRDIHQRISKAAVKNLRGKAKNSRIFELSPLCVQDPFDLSHNLTQNISMETLELFCKFCREAKILLSCCFDAQPNNAERNLKKSDGFIDLFLVPNNEERKSDKHVYSFKIPYVSSTYIPLSPLEKTSKFVLNLLKNDLRIICERLNEKVEEEAGIIGPTPLTKEMNDDLESGKIKREKQNKNIVLEEIVLISGHSAIKEDVSSFSCKRRRDYGEKEEQYSNHGKRLKMDVEKEKKFFDFLCVAYEVSWLNRRRQRRVHAINGKARNFGSYIEQGCSVVNTNSCTLQCSNTGADTNLSTLQCSNTGADTNSCTLQCSTTGADTNSSTLQCPTTGADTNSTTLQCSTLGADTKSANLQCSTTGTDTKSTTLQCSTTGADTNSTILQCPTPGADAKSTTLQCPTTGADRNSTTLQCSTPGADKNSATLQCPTTGADTNSATLQCPSTGADTNSSTLQCPTTGADTKSTTLQCPTTGADTNSTTLQCSTTGADTKSTTLQCSTTGADTNSSTLQCPTTGADTNSATLQCPSTGADTNSSTLQCPTTGADTKSTTLQCPTTGADTNSTTLQCSTTGADTKSTTLQCSTTGADTNSSTLQCPTTGADTKLTTLQCSTTGEDRNSSTLQCFSEFENECHQKGATLPIFKFKLTIVEQICKEDVEIDNEVCEVVLTYLKGSFSYFSNFYAFFKKFLLQKLNSAND